VTIDIMMPFWGDLGQFRDAVASVRAQDDPDWRLVIIDDHFPGTEHTEFVHGIGDERITLVRNETNLGVAGNFQRSIDLATAEYLVIMGCDDLLAPSYVSRMRELVARHPDADYLQPGVQVIDDSGRHVRPLADRVKGYYRPARGVTRLTGPDLARSVLRGNWTYFPSILWKRETIASFGFRADFEVVLDLALQFDIATSGGTLVIDSAVTFFYRRHSESVSSTTATSGARFDEERRFFDEAEARCRALGWTAAARAAHHHWSSRLNAATRIPSAVLARDGGGFRSLSGHALRARRSVEPGGSGGASR